jgi:NADH-quinone oxidoreductase subunit N
VQSGLFWLAFIGVLNVITSLYYYLKVVKVMYVNKPAVDSPLPVSLDHKIIQYLSIIGILFLGIYQGPIVRLAEQAFLNFPK